MRRLPTLSAVLSLAVPSTADVIYLTDGKTISDVTIEAENLEAVSYKKDRSDGKVPSDKVLSVVYTDKPSYVDSADASIALDEFVAAEADLITFLEGVAERPPRRHPWSRAYAFHRLITVYQVMGRTGELVATADRLAELEPESRYLPFAILEKARALADAGDSAKALAALGDLEKLIRAKGLGERWQLELELGRALLGSERGEARREKLADLSVRAGTAFPVVRNKAEVAIGSSLLMEGKLAEAEKVFEAVTEDPKADDRTLAAAYSGRGQCLFGRAEAAGNDPELLREALKSFMRVVVLYKNQVAYLPESLFYAGRCWQLLGGDDADDRANKLYRKVIRNFPENHWARQAREFKK